MSESAPASPKPPTSPGERKALCLIHPEAVVCGDARLVGPGGIKIGEGSIVHPACILNAKNGPIEIGKFNIIEEQCEFVNSSRQPIFIGHHNVFEVGSKIGSSCKIGDSNIFECRSTVGDNCVIGSGCTIGIKCNLPSGTNLPDETVVVGGGHIMHEEQGAKESHNQAIVKQIEVLKETLPRCHNLKKTGK